MSDKISSKHLERAACVYIRQSTLHQVRNNLESGRLQYALKDRARGLGFKNVVIVDEDLGISGAGNRERPGIWPTARGGVQRRSRRGVRAGGIPTGPQ